MPRSRGGAAPSRSAPVRPSASSAPSRSTPQYQQQTRPMSGTAAHPPATGAAAHPPAVQQSQGPGLFGQMASTAAGVAVGSSIGHAIGGFFGGGSSSSATPEQSQAQQPSYTDSYAQPGQQMDSSLYSSNYSQAQQANNGPCAVDIKNFTDCMTHNNGNIDSCGWLMEQMQRCQSMARNY